MKFGFDWPGGFREDNLKMVYGWITEGWTPEHALSPTGSALARTYLSPLTNGNWVIHAEYSCFLHPPF